MIESRRQAERLVRQFGIGEAPLGERAAWRAVGYAGEAAWPVPGTYMTLGTAPASITAVPDSGAAPDLANLTPLVTIAVLEAGFALEAGPLSTWNN